MKAIPILADRMFWRQPHRYLGRWRCLGMLACCALLQSCFLFPKGSSGKKGGSGSSSDLIVRDASGFIVDRTGDGTNVQVQFKTSRSALCQLALYSQDPKIPPAITQPKTVACSGADTPRTDFKEGVDGMRVDTLYFIIITAWEPGGDATHGDTVTIREQPDTGSFVVNGPGAQPGNPGTGNIAFNELRVARLNVPLKTAEVYRTVLPTALDVAMIKGQITRVLGCQQGTAIPPAQFRDAAKEVGIQNLATRDFAVGSAVPHPDYPERLQIYYQGINAGQDTWTLFYQKSGTDVVVPVRPVASITNMNMTSTSVFNFVAPTFGDSGTALKIDATKPLKFAWTAGSTLLDQSYMTVQIGRPDYNKFIYCVFDASKLVGEIAPDLLQNLDTGSHVVLTELATNMLWAKDGWLVTTYDWRSGSIEK